MNKYWVCAVHGLINRSIQCFIRDTYGPRAWADVSHRAGIDPAGFEAMFRYDDALTEAMLEAATGVLNKPRVMLLEDLGTYLVSHPNLEALRRLLRFGGETFVDFLHSLDELPDRARLAVPDLDLPELELVYVDGDTFRLTCRGVRPGFGHVLVGLLRTLADDYGALAYLEHLGECDGTEEVSISLLDSGFSAGRRFDLAARI